MAGDPRFAIPPGSLAAGELLLGGSAGRHMRVLRLEPGARVTLFDGLGREATAELLRLSGSEVVLQVDEPREGRAESGLQVHLVQAVPVKLPRFDTVVRTCTELGVVSIRPLLAAHGQLPGGGVEVIDRRRERWQRIAATAAEQCGRARVPEIRRPRETAALGWERLPRPLLMLQPGADVALRREALAAPPRQATILVGPEGGWAPDELELAAIHDALAVSMGPRVLRADSAGVVALTLMQSLWGDLR